MQSKFFPQRAKVAPIFKVFHASSEFFARNLQPPPYLLPSHSPLTPTSTPLPPFFFLYPFHPRTRTRSYFNTSRNVFGQWRKTCLAIGTLVPREKGEEEGKNEFKKLRVCRRRERRWKKKQKKKKSNAKIDPFSKGWFFFSRFLRRSDTHTYIRGYPEKKVF